MIQEAGIEPGQILAILGVLALGVWRIYNEHYAARDNDGDRSIELRKEEVDHLLKAAPGILERELEFYRKLSVEGKTKFLKRLQYTLATKRFIAKEGFILTPESEVLASAAFVQIGFGHHVSLLDRFYLVAIYPDVFYNKLLRADLKGSTSPKGVLRLSWKHLKHGYQIADDNINLALHELGHAVKIVVNEREGVGKKVIHELNAFNERGSEVRDAILEGKMDAIRGYAATNAHEFFACCVEYFFENPESFKKNLPELYRRMALLLNLDLTQTAEDYVPGMEVLKQKLRKRGILQKTPIEQLKEPGDWYQWMIVAGLIFGWFLTGFLLSGLVSDALTRFLFLLTVTVIGLLLFYRRFLVTGFMSVGSFFTFLLFGWTPIISSVGISLNNAIPVYTQVETVSVSGVGFDKGEYLAYALTSDFEKVNSGIVIEPEIYRRIKNEKVPHTLEVEVFYGMFALQKIGDYRCYPSTSSIPRSRSE